MAEKLPPTQRPYWTEMPEDESQPHTAPRMACPRVCGGVLIASIDGPLVRWACTGCAYVIHS